MVLVLTKKFFSRIKIFFNVFVQGYRDYKLAIITLTIIGFLSALMEGVGINALVPMFTFITGNGAADDFVSQTIEKTFIFFHIDFKLKFLLVFIAILFALKGIFSVLSEYLRIKIVADYEEKTRNKLFEKFLYSNWQYLLKHKLGHMQTVLITNVETSAAILSYISSFIIIFTSLIVYIAIAINIDLRITLFTLFLGGAIFFGLMPFIKKIRNFSYSIERINRDIGHHINENILGMKTIKVMSATRQVINNARNNFRELKITKVAINVWQAGISALIQPLSLFFVLVIFSYSYKAQTFRMASFIAIVYLIKMIFSHIEALQKKILSFNAAIPFFKKISDYEREAEENKEIDMGRDGFSFKKELNMKDIEFFYNKEKRILSDINFSIKKGEMVALIGPSGAGKTTVVDLILRLFTPTGGEILLDGKNINKIKIRDWRNNIGYVSQDIFLTNSTIADNIKFYDVKISDEEMAEAARMANIYKFIEGLPEKFNTAIGERGIELSAGQRQRIVIARALVRNPQILILDEATSALDNESEVKIQEVIERLKGKITVFVIAHRLSTIINCDKLLVLENGKIVEEGKPKELLKDKKTYFYKVYNIRNNNK